MTGVKTLMRNIGEKAVRNELTDPMLKTESWRDGGQRRLPVYVCASIN